MHLALFSTLFAVFAAPAAEISWGREGVTFAQYRANAITCGRTGTNIDISREPATQNFVEAEGWHDRYFNMPTAGTDVAREQAQMVQRLSFQRKLRELQGIHLNVIEACRTQLGYQRFTLFREQIKALHQLPLGSMARRVYLHRFGSDADILRRKAVRVPNSR